MNSIASAANFSMRPRKWPNGVYAAWYPIKATDAGRLPWCLGFTRRCARPGLRLEMLIDDPRDGLGSTGAGFWC